MTTATLPMNAGYLRKLAEFQSSRETARRAQRRLDQALHSRTVSPLDLQNLQDEVEELWMACDRAGSELAKARAANPKRQGARP